MSCFCRDLQILIVSSCSSWKGVFISSLLKRAERKFLSKAMLWPRSGVDCREFVLINELIC